MDGNEGARPSDPRRISNEGAPPADPENRRRGGAPWGRIIAALIGLLLLALLIPLACQALRGGDPGGGAGNTEGEQQGAAGETTGEQARGGGESTAASGGTTSGSAPAAGGDTSATGGGTSDGEIASGAAPAAVLDTGGEQTGDGTTVTVPRAQISGVDGWLAVHADDNGQPGEVLGHAPLREGENTDVAVRLDKPAESGRLYAMVHADDPDDDLYTFPDGDPPIEADGQIVVEPIQYTATGGQAGGDLPASGGPPVLPALLIGGLLLVVSSGAVLVGRRPGGKKA